ncbi:MULTISPECIES: Tc toxin subunit A [Pseudomonas]|uniref:Insecticidal toxin complex protein n=2 Tax=Pseudomonas syringae group TaxID=136849 RepID=A0A3M4IMM6_PSEVI|nr:MULTISPECIES: Tc toxin subunit A [Pseudomonas]KTB73676.1 insecticidal toxin complex protein [Pseudomonas sp. ICMP 3272]RMP11748.1 Insecticidal toxin complex protein [Pseudomonas syringae pv. persicae]RMQ06098.1 Insecticidal toxin complex protein [Pseudomonas viridiflava]RMQ75751.1 Insecticidal toxin complex protein [Pseudomonas viridiflava]
MALPSASLEKSSSPTYASLFPENLAHITSSGALDSNDGPIAYLSDLYQRAIKLEIMADNKAIKLGVRRPALGDLLLDETSAHQTVSALKLVIDILANPAQMLAGITPLPNAIAASGSHATLPFHLAFQQMRAVLEQKGITLFDVHKLASYDYPNFCYQNFRQKDLRAAILSGSGLDPSLHTLLLDNETAAKADFFKTAYGVAGSATEALLAISDVALFRHQTGLSEQDLYDLLALKSTDDGKQTGFSTTVKRSEHLPVASQTEVAASQVYGASFINNASSPAIAITVPADSSSGQQLTNVSASHFARLHKLIHLQHFLGMPFADVDTLVMSALRAEGQTKDFHFTANTLRAISVFRYLHRDFKVSAWQFATMLGALPVYSVGQALPALDTVLGAQAANGNDSNQTRVIFDDAEFDLDTDAGQATLAQMCYALKIDEQTARDFVATTQRFQQPAAKGAPAKLPKRSLTLFSALYRQVYLPRLLRLSPQAGAGLMSLLFIGNDDLLKQLAGAPTLLDKDDQPDILDVIMAAVNLSQWARLQNIGLDLLALLLTPTPDIEAKTLPAPADWLELITESADRLGKSSLTEARLASLAAVQQVALKDDKNTWLQLFNPLIDTDGWVKAIPVFQGQDRLAAINAQISICLAGALAQSDALDVDAYLKTGEAFAAQINGALIAQEDVIKSLGAALSGNSNQPGRSVLSEQHVLLLLRWLDISTATLLNEIKNNAIQAGSQNTFSKSAFVMWSELKRHAELIMRFNLSPAGLELLLEYPEQMALDESGSSLDLCYQLSCLGNWVKRAQETGYQESDVLDYLQAINSDGDESTGLEAAERLAKLIGWNAEETLCAVGTTYLPEPKPAPEATKVIVKPDRKTFADYLASLDKSSRDTVNGNGGVSYIAQNYYWTLDINNVYSGIKPIFMSFQKFLSDNPGPLIVSPDEFTEVYSQNKERAEYLKKSGKLLKFKGQILGFTDRTRTGNPLNGLLNTAPKEVAEAKPIQKRAFNVADVDQVLRLQLLCQKTGLSCQSLIALTALDAKSSYGQVQSLATLLFASCDEAEQHAINIPLNEAWRDALVGYLLINLPNTPDYRFSTAADADDLSNFLLTDVQVSSEVMTSQMAHATASLQHYLSRFFAHLEPGYDTAARNIIADADDEWRRYCNQYARWRSWHQQVNHPENLIQPALRPGKSQPFVELENELNQGKLTNDMVQLAVANYIGKFEHVSNLQVVSGYLDGFDPVSDTYHFIGKTNVEPTEYYWRSLDISKRDNLGQLSPLAWSEWEKIGLPLSGQIVQTPTTDGQTLDVIRPIIIAGRPYVIWVERSTTPIPSADETKQTPTKFRKITVHYCYKQIDGLWSPANELLALDGTKDGKRLKDENNNYLKDDTYKPGLIAIVDEHGKRENDPWLIALLYDATTEDKPERENPVKGQPKIPGKKKDALGTKDYDFFVQARDLLLIDEKVIGEEHQNEEDKESKLLTALHTEYNDARRIQHVYVGDILSSQSYKLEFQLTESDFPIESTTDSTKGENPTIFTRTYERAIINFFTDSTVLIQDSEHINGLENYIAEILEAIGISPPTKNQKKIVLQLMLELFNDIGNDRGNEFLTRNHSEFFKINHTINTPEYLIKHIKTLNLKTASTNGNLTVALPFTSSKISYEKRVFTTHEHLVTFVPVKASPSTLSTYVKRPLNKTLRISFNFLQQIPLPNGASSALQGDAAFASIQLKILTKAAADETFVERARKEVVANGEAFIEADLDEISPGTYQVALVGVDHWVVNQLHEVKIVSSRTSTLWDCKITRNPEQALYLELSGMQDLPFSTIRLNTLFGKQLVSRATQSVDRVLAWDTQMLLEPAIDAESTVSVDFHGANGRYFRELFLHLPFLVTTRLSEEKQFQEALRWCTEHLFDPYRTGTGEHDQPALWSTRPLADISTGTSQLDDSVDPAIRAFTSSRHYRQAVFLFLVEHWQREGDHYYRHLTRDSLTQAWLSYQQALKLIGQIAETSRGDSWTAQPLKGITEGAFRTPLNARLTDLRSTIEQRLFNLRHGLTLDGKAMPFLPLYATDDPFSHSSGKAGGLSSTYNSAFGLIPVYRFPALVTRVQQAIRVLTDMGRHLMHLMESEFDTSLSVQLQDQQVQLADFTIKLQAEALNAAQAGKQTLISGKHAIDLRHTFYRDQVSEGKTDLESIALRCKVDAAYMETATSLPEAVKGTLDALPNVFGMAMGGQEFSAPVSAAIGSAHALSRALAFASDRLTTEAEYERRSRGWQLEVDLAAFEMATLNQQIVEQDILIKSAAIAVEEAKAQRIAMQEAYVSMTTGFTIIPTYNWLVARMSTVYAPAYDAVLSMALALEGAWRYEIGDYEHAQFIRTGGWNDNFRGMLAGESLQLDVLEMEAAYLQSSERRMNIRKTVSLRSQVGITDDGKWLKTLQELGTKPLMFSLRAADFDRNYPGHYLRQLKHVSVSFKLQSSDPDGLQNLCAVLNQTGSTTLVRPDIEAARLLYGTRKSNPYLKTNLRAQQQIALSSSLSDDGRGIGSEAWLCELMFDDGRYLPFEGTGAISNWTLEFPDAEVVKQFIGKDNKAAVTDIQLHIVYTAAEGGSQFASSIKQLLKEQETPNS